MELENDEDLLILNLVSSLPDRNLLRFHVRSPLLFNTLLRRAYQWSIDAEDIDKYVVLPEGTGLKADVDNPSGPESFIYWTH
mgnify:FL=1